MASLGEFLHQESVAGLTQKLKQTAQDSGFQLVGVCRAVANLEYFTASPDNVQAQSLAAYQKMLQRMRAWIQIGYSAEMHYLTDRWNAYCHPNLVLPHVQSFLVLAAEYRTFAPDSTPSTKNTGRIASYAWGDDYHDTLRHRMKPVLQQHRLLAPEYAVRGCVDTAPLPEKFLASRAGLGRQGRHTLLIHPHYGSRLVLAVIASAAVLKYDEDQFYADNKEWTDRPVHEYDNTCQTPIHTTPSKNVSDWNPCEGCDACIRACPTSALSEHGLDARRCLSYWTIENRATIPEELQPLLGNRLFGCEVCQDVCRWNRAADAKRTPTNAIETENATQTIGDAPHSTKKNDPNASFAPRKGENPMNLETLLAMDENEFKRRFHGTPLLRPGLEKLKDTARMIQKTKK